MRQNGRGESAARYRPVFLWGKATGRQIRLGTPTEMNLYKIDQNGFFGPFSFGHR